MENRKLRTASIMWFGAALAATLAASPSAQAQEACGDTTCAKGFTCVAVASPCPLILCNPETNCQPCHPTETLMCQRASCEADSDCGPDMLCVEQSVNCTTEARPTCAPNEPCDLPPPPPPVCTSQRQCTFRWELACQADADCGPGFTCQDQQACGCSGSAGTGRVAPSGTTTATEVPVPPAGDGGCSCTPSGIKACQLTIVACTTDAECATGWVCRDNPSGTCWASSDGTSGCTPADPPRYCTPPNWNASGRGVPLSAEDQGNAPTLPAADGGTPPAPNGATPAEPDTLSRGGCSIGSSPSSAGAWLMLALGAVVGLVRRKRSL